MKKKILMTIFVSFIALSLNISSSLANTYQTGETKSNNTNVRSDNSANAPVISKFPLGQKITIIDSKDGWYKIKLSSGNDGWINSSLVNLKTSSETAVINADKVNLRESMSLDSRSMGFLSEGSEVRIISKAGDWIKVNINDIEGYVNSSHINQKNIKSPVTRGESRFGTLVSVAKDQLDKKYVWSAMGPDSFDCSGFTSYVYKKALGVNLPHSSKEQSSMGSNVTKNELALGDLVFFDTDNDGDVSHVGIYLGSGSFIHSSSGKGKVILSQLDEGFYKNTFMFAKRISN